MQKVKLYGIKNCDAVRKAGKWLQDHQVNYNFYDFREDGLTNEQINQWLEVVDLNDLVNKRSKTWKALSEVEKKRLEDSRRAIDLILAYPTLIKRPVLCASNSIQLGFSAEKYQALFS